MHTPPHQEVSHQFQEAIRSWTETGNNAETLGHWRVLLPLAVSLVGWPNHNLQIRPPGLYIHAALIALMSGKRVEEKFRTRISWNVPHTVGAIDGEEYRHEEAKKSGSDYYNYKGFFSLVLLTLVDTEYRFLWTDCGSSGSCSEAQIFNRSN